MQAVSPHTSCADCTETSSTERGHWWSTVRSRRPVTSSCRSDFTLLAAWVAGDRRAGGALIRRQFGVLERFFANKAPEAEQADLIQSTLLECTRSVERFRGTARFRTYLLSVARNVLLHHYRTRARKLDLLDPLTHSVAEHVADGAFTRLARVADQQALVQALRHLPMDLQIVLELRYFERMTLGECAAVLELPPSTVSHRIRRAKQLLRGLLSG